MSDDNKNKELEDALMSEQVEDDFLDDLENADSDGLDDFINTELDEDVEDSVLDDDVDYKTTEDSELDTGEESSEEDELSELDSQISDLEDELSDISADAIDENLESNDDEVEGGDGDEDGDSESASAKKPFKLKTFHIVAGVASAAALLIVGSKLMPEPTPQSSPQTVPVAIVDNADMEKDLPKEEPLQDASEPVKPIVNEVELEELLGKQIIDKDAVFHDKTEVEPQEEFDVSELVSDVKESVDSNDLINMLTKDRIKADGIYVKTLTKDGDIVIAEDQDDNMLTLRVGSEIEHYGDTLRVDNILSDGKLVLLSDGFYMDMVEKKIDTDKLAKLKEAERNEQRKADQAKKEEQEKIDKMIAAAIAIEKEKIEQEFANKVKMLEKNNAVLQAKSVEEEMPQAKQGTLTQAIDRIEKIELSINEPKQPKLLTGWSINASFKVKKDGFIVNGYLIKNAYGDFYRVIVGDQFDNYGIVKGYDDNGKFFIGNHYIL